MNRGVDDTGRANRSGSELPAEIEQQERGSQGHRSVTKADVKPVFSGPDAEAHPDNFNNTRPKTTSIQSRSFSALESESSSPLSLGFCEFQLEVAEKFAEEGPVSDKLTVYWVTEDNREIAVDPRSKECNDELWAHYQTVTAKFKENSDEIIQVCEKQLDDARARINEAHEYNEAEMLANDPLVTFSLFFSMVEDDESWASVAQPEIKGDSPIKDFSVVRHSDGGNEKNVTPPTENQLDDSLERSSPDPVERLASKMRDQRLEDERRNKEEKPPQDKLSAFLPTIASAKSSSSEIKVKPELGQVGLESREEPLDDPKRPYNLTTGASLHLEEQKEEEHDGESISSLTTSQASNIPEILTHSPPEEKVKQPFFEADEERSRSDDDSGLTKPKMSPVSDPTNKSSPEVDEHDDGIDLKKSEDSEVPDTELSEGSTADELAEANSFLLNSEQELLNRESQQSLQDILNAEAMKAQADFATSQSPFQVKSHSSSIRTAVERLANAVKEGEKGRFQTFFDDPIVSELSGLEVSYNDEKAEGQELDVDWIEPFVTAYKSAILLEKKAETPDQIIKRARRIKAINAIETFIKGQDKQSPDYKKGCLLACQMLLRVREPGFVCQRGTPRCGGFALLQTLWRTRPDQVTKTLLGLYSSEQKAVVTAQNGQRVILTAPGDVTAMEEAQEDWADKLFIYSLYKSAQKGSSLSEDAYKAFYFEKRALLQTFKPTNKAEQDRFLKVLLKAADEKCSMVIAFNGEAAALLRTQHQFNLRQPRKSKQQDDTKIQYFVDQRGTGSAGHAIIVDSVSLVNNGRDIELKLHTWGKSSRYRISRDDFFKQLKGEGEVAIYAEKPLDGVDAFFSEPPHYSVGYIDGHPTYIDCTGKKEPLPINQVYKGLGGIQYYCYKNGKYLEAKKYEKFLPLKSTSDSVVWSKKPGEKERVLRGLPSNQVYLVKEDGEAKLLGGQHPVKGFDGIANYKLTFCDDTSFAVKKTSITLKRP